MLLTSTYSWLPLPVRTVCEKKESIGWEALPIGNVGGMITTLNFPQINGVWTNCCTVLRISWVLLNSAAADDKTEGSARMVVLVPVPIAIS